MKWHHCKIKSQNKEILSQNSKNSEFQDTKLESRDKNMKSKFQDNEISQN